VWKVVEGRDSVVPAGAGGPTNQDDGERPRKKGKKTEAKK
jgi:hypothetical protein